MSVQHLYDKVADRYDDLVARTNYVGHRWLECRLKELSDEQFIAASIVDLGCANGSTGILLRKAFPGASIRGFDISPQMVALARRRGCYDSVEIADLNELLPTVNGRSQDVVVLLGAIEFIHDPVALLGEVARILTPTGRLLISFQEHWPQRPVDAPRQTHSGAVLHYAYSKEEVSRMLQANGLVEHLLESTIGYVSGTGFACPYVFCVARLG